MLVCAACEGERDPVAPGAEASSSTNEAAAAVAPPAPQSGEGVTAGADAVAATPTDAAPVELAPTAVPEPEPEPEPTAVLTLMRESIGPRLARPEARAELVELLQGLPALAPAELEDPWRELVAAVPESGSLAGVCTQCHVAHRLHFRSLRGALPMQRARAGDGPTRPATPGVAP